MKNGLSFFILFFFSALSISTQAQEISLKLRSFPGIAYTEGSGYFYGGGGLEVAYQHRLKVGQVQAGLEYRIIDWGNQLGLNLAYQHPILQKERWRLDGALGGQVGLALFRESPLFVWAIDYSPSLTWYSQKRFFTKVQLGIRYSNCPKYKDYGSIHSVWEVPIGLGLGFRLGEL